MTVRVALLRAVNVGGTGKLDMGDLRRLCADLGYADARTLIASGNVIFRANASEPEVRAALEEGLLRLCGRAVGVLVRSGEEMRAVVLANPYPEAPRARATAIFLDAPPPPGWREGLKGLAGERLEAVGREIYVHYPDGMAASKLRIPAAAAGTARNLNTVAKLAELAGT